MKLTILGCNSAIPANGRYPTAQVLQVENELFLIDCGEGTQMRMNEQHIARGKIQHIFISHLHGDHVFGLIGLLTSYSLNQRTSALHLYGPAGLEELISVQIKYTGSHLSYPLHFHVNDTETSQRIFSNSKIEVITIPLVHRVPCCGFLFREHPRPLNIISDVIAQYNMDYTAIKAIKDGADYITNTGERIPNHLLTHPPKRPRSYAFCSDTSYQPSIIPIIQGVDLLYHETTFMTDMSEWAMRTGHTTAAQAATIAQRAKVGQLVCGHYSSRYKDLQPLLEEARSIFPNTILGLEGRNIQIGL